MLVNYWDKYTEMHGQQNVKIRRGNVRMLRSVLVTIVTVRKQQCVLSILSTTWTYWVLHNNTFMANLFRVYFAKITTRFCQSLSKSGFSEQIFLEVLYIKFHRHRYSGWRTDECRQTDGRTLRSQQAPLVNVRRRLKRDRGGICITSQAHAWRDTEMPLNQLGS